MNFSKRYKLKCFIYGLIFGVLIMVVVIYLNKEKIQNLVVKEVISYKDIDLKEDEYKDEHQKEVLNNVEEDNIEQSLRIQNYKIYNIPENIQKGDYVDLRLKKDLDDKIVLVKKEIIDINEAEIWIKINEKERILMNYALYDEKLNQKNIYLTKYVRPSIQLAAKISYVME